MVRAALATLLLLEGTHSWVTTSQSVYGASLDNIKGQMKGAPTPEGVKVQGELGLLWS